MRRNLRAVMRNWFLNIPVIAVLCSPAFDLRAEDQLQAPSLEKGAMFRLNPYLQNLQRDSVSILFRTAEASHCWVEFGETESLGAKAEGTRDGLKSANIMSFSIRLRNLKPGTRYFYRVKGREILDFQPYEVKFGESFESRLCSFETPMGNAESVKAIIFNDLHNQAAPLKELVKLPQAANFDASIFNGDCLADLAGPAAAMPILEQYLGAVSAASRQAVFVRGNHEIRGGLARELSSFFEFPEGKFYFAFTRGEVRFVFIDCGEDKEDAHWAYSGLNDFEPYREEVARWLEREVNSAAFKAARWHILIHHIPLYGGDASSFSVPLYEPIVEKAPFDLAVNGHTHDVNVIPVGESGNRFPVFVGGGPGMKRATMIVIEANRQRLSVKTLDTGGRVMHQWESSSPASKRQSVR